MLNCFTTDALQKAIPIVLVTQKQYPTWLAEQPETIKSWLTAMQYRNDIGNICFIPDAHGHLAKVICSVSTHKNRWDVGHLALSLPEACYSFDNIDLESETYIAYALAFGLGAYQFTRYKKPVRQSAQLRISKNIASHLQQQINSIYLVRDLINTPTDDMGPSQFAAMAEKIAKEHQATCKQIVGEDLLKQNYASIYTVGRASDDAPRLIDIRWGNPKHRKVTLVGKGVCFDSGGLDIKPSSYMLLMKKDMAGGAHVLGLARMLMQAKCPISLRVLIPVVENVISGNAYRPGDIIQSRQGITIEVGNTDCEGRVILADALTEAVSEKPDLLIDITTLTGAARIALGTDIPALFSNQQAIAQDVLKSGEETQDLLWQLPLFTPYRDYLNSIIADINNNASEPYAGAITAALFLKEFVPDDIPWLHLDMMAWNLRTRPGKPQGGEACGLRALFDYISKTF